MECGNGVGKVFGWTIVGVFPVTLVVAFGIGVTADISVGW